MALGNPYTDDPVLGDAWEQGYLAGFSEPETDHFRPFDESILEVFTAGEQAGRDERRRLPPDEGGTSSTDHGQLEEIAGDVGLHALGHGFFHMIFGQIGGLISLVTTVLQIPGDVMLQPLEDDWTGPADDPEEAQVVFVAVCPRTDHGPPLEGATAEGYWAAPGRNFFSDALHDKEQHNHPEAGIARCAVPDGTCGLVWPGTGN